MGLPECFHSTASHANAATAARLAASLGRVEADGTSAALRGWVAALPSYSEHLVRDVGGLLRVIGS